MEHWYDNEISRGILAAKYYHEGETTPQQFIDRVSSIFKGDFRERMKNTSQTEIFLLPEGRFMRQVRGANLKYPCQTAISCRHRKIIWNPFFILIMKLPVFFPMAAVSVSIFPISVLQEAVYIMWHVLPPVPFLS